MRRISTLCAHIVRALACDMTRIACLGIGRGATGIAAAHDIARGLIVGTCIECGRVIGIAGIFATGWRDFSSERGKALKHARLEHRNREHEPHQESDTQPKEGRSGVIHKKLLTLGAIRCLTINGTLADAGQRIGAQTACTGIRIAIDAIIFRRACTT